MAGPCSAILIPTKLEVLTPASFPVMLKSLVDEVLGQGYFRLDARTFVYSLGWEYEEQLIEYAELNSLLGWAPLDLVVFGAMCNGPEDHKALGSLTLGLASAVGGVIEFGSLLEEYTRDEQILQHPEYYPYGGTSILGVNLMKAWLLHRDFAMVK